MRLDIFISTEVKSPKKRYGSYRAFWVGYSDTGKKLGEDGVINQQYGNEYGLLVLALKEAVGHINKNVRPEIRICCNNRVILQSLKHLKSWEKTDFKKTNGQEVAYRDEWKYIASRLEGLIFRVEGGK